jgi:HNH endonuclease
VKAHHRRKIEDLIGRTLTSAEVVHHIDGDPTNNDLNNLVVTTHGDHARWHNKGKGPLAKTVHKNLENKLKMYDVFRMFHVVKPHKCRPYYWPGVKYMMAESYPGSGSNIESYWTQEEEDDST